MAEPGPHSQTQGILGAATSGWRTRGMMVLLLIAALAIAFSPTIRTLQEAWADTQGLTYTEIAAQLGYRIISHRLELYGRKLKG